MLQATFIGQMKKYKTSRNKLRDVFNKTKMNSNSPLIYSKRGVLHLRAVRRLQGACAPVLQ